MINENNYDKKINCLKKQQGKVGLIFGRGLSWTWPKYSAVWLRASGYVQDLLAVTKDLPPCA